MWAYAYLRMLYHKAKLFHKTIFHPDGCIQDFSCSRTPNLFSPQAALDCCLVMEGSQPFLPHGPSRAVLLDAHCVYAHRVERAFIGNETPDGRNYIDTYLYDSIR